MKKKNIIITGIIVVSVIPLWMFLAWVIWPKKKLTVAIIDKTVLTNNGQEHVSLTWVLNNQKFTKNKTDLYKVDRDYFGFFPKENQQFKLKGLERFTEQELEKLSVDADAAYITDAYGVYKQEWFSRKMSTERSGVLYGGMSEQDISLLQKLKAKNKLIVSEFNCIGSPTSITVRNKFEQSFGVRWSGWVGKFFDNLDTNINKELPRWLVKGYLQQHNNQWPFKQSGIAFVHENNTIEIIENTIHLTEAVPFIASTELAQEKFQLPAKIYYPFWFDIVQAHASKNTIVAQFELGLTNKGKEFLQKVGIPPKFPAVQMHESKEYRFYYFSADFSDNPIKFSNSYYKGIHYLNWMFDKGNTKNADRTTFFWKFYEPLMRNILDSYYSNKKS
jgi:hypothetical protein